MAQYEVLMKVPMVNWPLLFAKLDTGRVLCGAISRCNDRTQNSQVPSCPDYT